MAIALQSLVNLLIGTLYTSTRDYEQYRSRIYQRAKVSRQGGTTPTTRKLEYRVERWTYLLQQAKTSWYDDQIEEYAKLLAAYHEVGDFNVPTWVHQVYRSQEM